MSPQFRINSLSHQIKSGNPGLIFASSRFCYWHLPRNFLVSLPSRHFPVRGALVALGVGCRVACASGQSAHAAAALRFGVRRRGAAAAAEAAAVVFEFLILETELFFSGTALVAATVATASSSVAFFAARPALPVVAVGFAPGLAHSRRVRTGLKDLRWIAQGPCLWIAATCEATP
jgi:hypothetical protein